MNYGLRAVIVVILLALGCRWGIAQIGPRHVLELPGGGAATAGMEQGRVQLAGPGLTLIRFQGLSILAVDADTQAYSEEAAAKWPAADLVLVTPPAPGHFFGLGPAMSMRGARPVIIPQAPNETITFRGEGLQLYPMQAWETLDARKSNTRLRVTAMAGAARTVGVAGFMLELGNSRASYRVYVSCERQDDAEALTLAQRLPGADLLLLPARHSPELVTLKRAAGPVGKPAALTEAGYAFKAIRR
ncbi:hypothetical protein [Duganella callida]|uniref:MBL fold metallo-hydrolase n=1 Tax=Duganella callida TaxID=2561932 RepID=A0A4Y9SST4_9BURK|nr:hypothetical protein [Duganella callida]TFW28557.1 hypothetical protein E4L98_05460 [Duganella callida]